MNLMDNGSISLNELYFDYLYSRFGHHYKTSEIDYKILFKTLHKMEYYWVLPHDENRASDAYTLRHEFYDEFITSEYFNFRPLDEIDDAVLQSIPSFDEVFSGSCTVLEVLCALASRFESEIAHDDNFGNRETQWLWEMFDNLGFCKYVDRKITDQDIAVVKAKIQKVLDRTYQPDGRGGFFPRTNPYLPDQRDLELWYQISGYFSERGVV